jgi:hypothetical protein
LFVAACGSAAAPPPSKPAPPPVTATCDSMRDKVAALYRDDAQQHEPKRVDEAVADNTQMVMIDCAKRPAKAVPCLQAASSVAQIETQCLIPLHPDGTEDAP